MVSACLADRPGYGLSAVYSFFAPALERRSLGTHAILWLIERARSLVLPYVYLGYWVPESRKMAYKLRFRPAEVLAGGAWRMRSLSDADAGDGVGAGREALVPESAGLIWTAAASDAVTGFVQGQTRAITSRHRRSRRCRCRLTS